ncbi:hypothetical protein AM1BK_20800 [Neobacillus kokaensis]|uniref:ABC-2 type transporter transmembrane domain-containing protein n=1 Tax=Neobacillus kokaensis TaxID=2759023 RepID=A0ABQ3N1I8_9BACI|nr:hypothetical protein AM1BK_20800 [Neobacillus kokaensis]
MKNGLFKQELFTIIKNKKILIPIIAVLFIPVLYAGLFLWAFWDPYGKMDELPVAIVNNDKGAVMDDEQLKLGEDLVEKLKKSKDFDYQILNKQDGYNELKKQKYYMLIEIPENFSNNATTLMDKNPKKLELIYVPNEGFNFLSAQIGGTAAEKIKTAVAEKVTETYAETIFEKINDVSAGFQKASNGAEKLSDGSKNLNKGSADLNTGIATLAKKSIEFNNGMKSADEGSKKLASGSNDLYNGLAILAEKSIEFNAGMQSANSGVQKLASGSKDLDDGLAVLAEKSGEFNAGMQSANSGANKVAAGSKQLNEGLGQLLNGHKKLEIASTQLEAGGKQLHAGAEELSLKLSEWQKGSTSAVKGAEDLNQGITSLKKQITQMMPLLGNLPEDKKAQLIQALDQLESGSAALKSGTKDLSDAASQLSDGAEQISTKLEALHTGQKSFSDQMELFGEKFKDAKAGADQLANGSSTLLFGMNQLTDGSNALTEGAVQLSSGSQALRIGAYDLLSGMEKLASGSDALSSGAGQIASGSSNLKNGASDLSSGMSQLTNGADAITSGAGKLADGSEHLKDGTSQLTAGTTELADKLKDGAKEVSKVHANDKTYDMMSKPVKLDTEKVNHVPNYGTGFTPYFLSLGLFVGALLLSIVFPMRDPAVTPANGFNWFISKFAILAVFGVVQALIADAVILGALNLHVASVPKFILFSIITSLTFISLVQFFVTVFADAGRFLAILVLIFQLTTSAGTFPLELIPNFLQHFNAFLPMTYTVSGFKAVISSGDYSFMWHNLTILFSYIVVFALLTTSYLTIRHNAKYKIAAQQ